MCLKNINKLQLSAAAVVVSLCVILMTASSCTTTRSVEKQRRELLTSYISRVHVVVSNAEQEEQLSQIGIILYEQLTADIEVLAKLIKDFENLNRNYDTSREDLAAALEAIDKHRLRMRQTILVARMKAVSLTSTEEWDSLMSLRETLLSRMQKTPGLL